MDVKRCCLLISVRVGVGIGGTLGSVLGELFVGKIWL